MIRNSFKARLVYGLVLYLAGAAHHEIVQGVSNTPQGMLVYHASAAATDFLLLVCASSVLKRRLLDDMQVLCLLSMIVNFAGWLLYMAWTPPTYYNTSIEVLTYVQYARLFTMDLYGIDRAGGYLFRGHDLGR